MKNFNKIVLILIIVLILFIILFMFFVNTSTGIGTPGINLDEFDKIQLGMEQSEVNNIIDKLNEWDNDEVYDIACQEISSEKENGKYIYSYKYIGEKEGYAIITFEVDYSDGFFGLKYPEVIKKEEFNLK